MNTFSLEALKHKEKNPETNSHLETQSTLLDLEKKIKEYALDNHIDASLNTLGKQIEKNKEQELNTFLEDANHKNLSRADLKKHNPEQFQLMHLKGSDILFKIYAKIAQSHKGRNQKIDMQKYMQNIHQLSLNNWNEFLEIINNETLRFDGKSLKIQLNLSPEDKAFIDHLNKNKSFALQYQKLFPDIIATTKQSLPALVHEYNNANIAYKAGKTFIDAFEKGGDVALESIAKNPQALLIGGGVLAGFTVFNWMFGAEDKRSRKEYISDAINPLKTDFGLIKWPLLGYFGIKMGYFGIKTRKQGAQFFDAQSVTLKEKAENKQSKDPKASGEDPKSEENKENLPQTSDTQTTVPENTDTQTKEPKEATLQEQITIKIAELKKEETYKSLGESFLTARAQALLAREKIPAEEKIYQLSQFTFEGKIYYFYEDTIVSGDKNKVINRINQIRNKEIESQTTPLSTEEQKSAQALAEKTYEETGSRTHTMVRMLQAGLLPADADWKYANKPPLFSRAKLSNIGLSALDLLIGCGIPNSKIKKAGLDKVPASHREFWKKIFGKFDEVIKYEIDIAKTLQKTETNQAILSKYIQELEDIKTGKLSPENMTIKLPEDLKKRLTKANKDKFIDMGKKRLESLQKEYQELQEAGKKLKAEKALLDKQIEQEKDPTKKKALREKALNLFNTKVAAINTTSAQFNANLCEALGKLPDAEIKILSQISSAIQTLAKANGGVEKMLSNLKVGKMTIGVALWSLARDTGSGNVIQAGREAASLATGFVPIASNIQGAVEAIMGYDYVAGRKLSALERVLSGITAIPVVGNVVGRGSKGIKIGNKATDIINQTTRTAKNAAAIAGTGMILTPIMTNVVYSVSSSGKRIMQTAENNLTPPKATH